MASFSVNVFKGIDAAKSPLVIDKEKAIEIQNLRIDNPAGALSGNLLGYEKWHSLGAGNAIQAIFQLQKHGYTNLEDTLFYLAKIGTTARWFIGKLTWYYINEYRTFGTWGSGDNQFKYSTASPQVAVDDDEYVYVADYVNYRIVKCKMDGTEFYTIGESGTYPYDAGKMGNPRAVVVVGDYIYCIVGANKLIKTEKDMSGVTWDVTSLASPTIQTVYSMCYDSVNNKLIFVGNDYFVGRCDLDGTNAESYSFYSNHSLSNTPYCVTFDQSTEFIYVGFSSGLVAKLQYGGTGWATRNCNTSRNVYGIALDSNGLVYITNIAAAGGYSWISVFDWDDLTSDVYKEKYGVTSPQFFLRTPAGSGPLQLIIKDDVIYATEGDYTGNTIHRILALHKDYLADA